MLILKRDAKFRPGGPWDNDDYDVSDDERHVGHILWTYATSRDTPWFWTITVRAPQKPTERGYPATRAEAMAAFKTAWEREP